MKIPGGLGCYFVVIRLIVVVVICGILLDVTRVSVYVGVI